MIGRTGLRRRLGPGASFGTLNERWCGMMRGMSGARRLLSITRDWPWGLTVVTDPGSSSAVPTRLDSNGVAASRDVVAVGIQHEIDGEAVAEVWVGQLAEDLNCIYDGEFATVVGAVILGDAAYEDHAPAEIGEGAHRLRVLVDEPGSPERVVFEFTRRADFSLHG